MILSRFDATVKALQQPNGQQQLFQLLDKCIGSNDNHALGHKMYDIAVKDPTQPDFQRKVFSTPKRPLIILEWQGFSAMMSL